MRIKIIMVILLLLVSCGCQQKRGIGEIKTIDPTPTSDPIQEKVEKQMQNMTLEEKIGQMLFIAYRKPELDTKAKEMLETVQPGGFILFKENFSSYKESLKFVKEVKLTGKVPLLIGIDQEGGIVQRLSKLTDMNATKVPQMYDVGLKNNISLTKKIARIMAEEMRVFGINIDFAPTLDIYSNPNNKVIGKRSFGKTPELVSNMGLSFGLSLKQNGVQPVYKHFPGHGNTSTDSHYGLPVVTKTLEDLESFELIPFKNAIASGAEMIMIGHLALPNITGDNIPASLSKMIVTDILKNKMGFQGLIITDAIDMGALTKSYTNEQIYEMAISSGVDIILMPTSPKDAINNIKNSITTGKITEDRINESVQKILTYKYKNIEKEYNTYLPSSNLGSRDHQDIVDMINAS